MYPKLNIVRENQCSFLKWWTWDVTMHQNKSPLEAQIFWSVKKSPDWNARELFLYTLCHSWEWYLTFYFKFVFWMMTTGAILGEILVFGSRSCLLQFCALSHCGVLWLHSFVFSVGLAGLFLSNPYIPSFFSFLRAPLTAFSSMLKNSRNSEYPCRFRIPKTLHLCSPIL